MYKMRVYKINSNYSFKILNKPVLHVTNNLTKPILF